MNEVRDHTPEDLGAIEAILLERAEAAEARRRMTAAKVDAISKLPRRRR